MWSTQAYQGWGDTGGTGNAYMKIGTYAERHWRKPTPSIVCPCYSSLASGSFISLFFRF